MADKLRQQQQLEAQQQKHIGTGHADTTSLEFQVNARRDYYASVFGHSKNLDTYAASQGWSIERARMDLLDKYALAGRAVRQEMMDSQRDAAALANGQDAEMNGQGGSATNGSA